MDENISYREKPYQVLLVLSTILIFMTAGCTSLFTPEPQELKLCYGYDNGTRSCNPISSPKETIQYYWFSIGDHDDKGMPQLFSKKITTNISLFSEDLQVSKAKHATVNGRLSQKESSTINPINETNALMNVTIIYPSGDTVERVVPFVREDGIWKIDMSPKYL